jgi:zinc/manganese transport system substrate-binding protein
MARRRRAGDRLPLWARIPALALLPVLAGCAVSAGAAADGRIRIVTSTDVYGAVARAVAGPDADVESFLTNAAQDPHSYAATPRNQLAVARADVLIENGGGFDDFLDQLRAASGRSGTSLLTAVRLTPHPIAAGGDRNEHVWYDLPTVARLATELAAVLGARDPRHAHRYAERAARFDAGLAVLERREAALRRDFGGTGVAITEPLPGYLLRACGLVARTPEQFSAGVEDGTGVPPAVLHRALDQLADGSVRALVYNAQTSGPETRLALDAANRAGVATVPVTETLPPGTGYLAWMRSVLDHLARALRS